MSQVSSQTSLSRKALAAAITLWLGVPAVQAAGVGSITQGTGSMSTVGAVTTVNQTSKGLRIDWSQFNVGVGETLAFVQPHAKAVAVNVVNSSTPAEVLGQLTATGNVFILSPNGLLIGAGATVNTGGHFVGSTAELQSFDPLTGALKSRGIAGNTAQVINAGIITAGTGSTVALIGSQVVNTGTIKAPAGQALLLAGDRVVFKSNDNSVINYVVDPSSVASSIANSGSIQAKGGRIELDARSLVSSVVNTSGVIEAGGVDGSQGVVRLTALGSSASITASGVVDAGASGKVTAQLGTGGALDYRVTRSGSSQAPQTQTIGVEANDKTYDGTTAATVDFQLSDLASGDGLALTIDQAEFDGWDADSGLEVFFSLSAFSTQSSAQRLYTLPSTLTASILTKEIGVTVDTKVYDGTANAVIRYNEADIVAADRGRLNVTLGKAEFDDQHAGVDKTVSYAFGLGGGGMTPGNYHLSGVASGTITPKQITASVQSKEYDGTRAATVTVNQSDIIEADRGQVFVTLGSAEFDNKNAGTNKLVTFQAGLGGAGVLPDNYEVVTSAVGTITPKALTLTATSDRKVYDGTTASGQTVNIAGLVQGDSVTGATQSFDSRNAGSRALVVDSGYTVADGNGGHNYTVSVVGAQGTIDRAPLTITANNDSKVQDGVPYAGGNGVSTVGLVAGESLGDLQGVLAYGGSSQGARAVGSYVISASGLSSGNYDISYQNGTLAINARTPGGLDDTVGNVNNGTQPTPINVDLGGLGDLLSGLPATAAGDEEDPEKVKTRRRDDRSPVRVTDGGVKVPATLR